MADDDHTTASDWFSTTTTDVLGEYASRRADEVMVVATAPRPLFLKRAVGIVRVSEVGKRAKEEKLLSPGDQRRQIERLCEDENLRLVSVFEELNVSAFKRTLLKRPGLGPAVTMIEHGEAEVLIVAYFDRFFRKLTVQAEVTQRVEDAGGELLAIDFGRISNRTSAQWLSANVVGMMAEFYARQTGEKTYQAQIEAVEKGMPPWAVLPLGYVRGDDRRIHVDPKAATVVRAAFELREAGASLQSIGTFLREKGYSRSFRSVQKMFYNRCYLGELRFGKLVNLRSHEAIIDARLFRSVAKMRGAPRGAMAPSPILLARQGLLYCGSCDGKLVAGGQNLKNRPDAPRRRQYDYRCNAVQSPLCNARPYISAAIMDAFVAGYVKRRLADAQGRYSDDERLAHAEAEAHEKEQRLNAAVATFDGLGDVAAIRAKLLEMQAESASARARLEELRATFGTAHAFLGRLWDDLTLAEQRAILRVFIKRIVVTRGRGRPDERITIDAFED